MKKQMFFFMAFVLLLVGTTEIHARRLVAAEGMSSINNNRVDVARDKAIDNAQRSAVERIAGVVISSSSEVENFQLKMDRIISESSGFINSYRILSEKREGDNYVVSIEADVGDGKLKDRLSALNLIMSRKEKPRLMLLFGGQSHNEAVAESAMARYLMSHGFRLIDAGAFRKTLEHENIQNLALNKKETASLGHRYGAEALVVGSVETSSSSAKFGNIEMTTNKVAVSAKVINVDTAEVLVTDSETKALPGMPGDFKKITAEAAELLARKMADGIMARWSSELSNTMTVKLVVDGFKSYQDFLQFKEQLAGEVKGFKEVYQRAYTDGRAELDIEVRGNSQGVADDLAALAFNARKLRITEITQNRIDATLLP